MSEPVFQKEKKKKILMCKRYAIIGSNQKGAGEAEEAIPFANQNSSETYEKPNSFGSGTLAECES